MVYWTTGELRDLRAFYPDMPGKVLARFKLPRHTPDSVRSTAANLDVARQSRKNKFFSRIYWLRVAHEYYALREQQMKENK